QREAAFVIDVDQFVGDRRLFHQNSKPSEWINPLIGSKLIFRDGLTAYPVKAVAADDVITVDFELLAVRAPPYIWVFGFDVVNADIERFINSRRAAGLAHIHQIACDFGLPIDQNGLAGQRLEIDAMADAAELNFGSIMDQAFVAHTHAGAGLLDQCNRALLENARPNAAAHIILGLLLKNNRINSGPVQQLTQQETGRARPYDDDLCSHVTRFSWLLPRSSV